MSGFKKGKRDPDGIAAGDGTKIIFLKECVKIMTREEPKKRKVGRPRRGASGENLRQKLIDAAVSLIRHEGAEQVTIRMICDRAGVSIGTFYHYFKSKDDLFAYFVREMPYGEIELHRPFSDLAGRITELWMHLVGLYSELGMDFMTSFYNSSNRTIASYAVNPEERFAAGSLLKRCQEELELARKQGHLRKTADPHLISADLGLIVNGCILDWVICRGRMPLEDSMHRIIGQYFQPIALRQKG